MSLEQIDSIIGQNDLAVAEVSEDPIIKKQFAQYSDETIGKAFEDIGIEEEGSTFTKEEQEQYILWSMAWTHVDDGEECETYPREYVEKILN